VTKGSTRTIVPFSPEMPTRDFFTKEEARRIGSYAAQIMAEKHSAFPERTPDFEETEDYRGFTIELRYFKNPSTVSMYA
jgi:hypothetical protein